MLIKRHSLMTGVEHELELPVTQEQLHRWIKGAKIQDVMPHLTADQREFIMTGITAEEWASTFPKEEDELLEEDDE